MPAEICRMRKQQQPVREQGEEHSWQRNGTDKGPGVGRSCAYSELKAKAELQEVRGGDQGLGKTLEKEKRVRSRGTGLGVMSGMRSRSKSFSRARSPPNFKKERREKGREESKEKQPWQTNGVQHT